MSARRFFSSGSELFVLFWEVGGFFVGFHL